MGQIDGENVKVLWKSKLCVDVSVRVIWMAFAGIVGSTTVGFRQGFTTVMV